MGAGILLPGVEQRRSLEEVEQRREVQPIRRALYQGGKARLIVVFEKAQLVVVCGVDGLLEVELLQPGAQRPLAVYVPVEGFTHVVLIFEIEGLKGLGIPRGVKALAPGVVAKALMYGLGQPHAAGANPGHRFPRALPEVHRYEGGHVTAEAVHHPCPHAERFDLIVPEGGISIVEVDHIRPIPNFIAGRPVRLAPEELRMLGQKHRVRRGVIIHHVDHQLHAPFMHRVGKGDEVLHRAVGGVDRAVVPVCVGAAEAPLLALDADGMDRHEPDHVRPQRADTVKVGDQGAKRPLLGMGAEVDGVDHLVLQTKIGILCHSVIRSFRCCGASPDLRFCFIINPQIFVSRCGSRFRLHCSRDCGRINSISIDRRRQRDDD